MSTGKNRINLKLNIPSDTGVEELADLTQQLREELLETDVPSVEYQREGTIPIGAKAGDAIAWGSLLLTLSEAGGVITSLIGVLHSWVNRHKDSSITLEVEGKKLEIKGNISANQSRVITEWLEFHSRTKNE